MKKLVFALAVLICGGLSLSTVSNANAAPVVSGIAEAGQNRDALQPVGGWRDKHGYDPYYQKISSHRKKGFWFKGHFIEYPKGYHKNFCYRNKGHWWCKKYFFKKLFSNTGFWFKGHFIKYPKGYYKGFCHDKPGHWWCKKYF